VNRIGHHISTGPGFLIARWIRLSVSADRAQPVLAWALGHSAV